MIIIVRMADGVLQKFCEPITITIKEYNGESFSNTFSMTGEF